MRSSIDSDFEGGSDSSIRVVHLLRFNQHTLTCFGRVRPSTLAMAKQGCDLAQI